MKIYFLLVSPGKQAIEYITQNYVKTHLGSADKPNSKPDLNKLKVKLRIADSR
jgi:hypothetical protein